MAKEQIEASGGGENRLVVHKRIQGGEQECKSLFFLWGMQNINIKRALNNWYDRRKIIFVPEKQIVALFSCLTNHMPNNQFKKGELYSFITGKAVTAIARNLQKKFNVAGMGVTIEQWSVLYHLWKEDGKSQQELCNATFRDKPSITRLVDNLEKLQLVKRVPSGDDRRINLIYLTKQAQKLQEETMALAEATLNEALEGVPADRVDVCKEVLQIVYENLK
jgi:DNA-binding MarR family transcriptional regulator